MARALYFLCLAILLMLACGGIPTPPATLPPSLPPAAVPTAGTAVPTPTAADLPNPLSPRPYDTRLQHGLVYLNSSTLRVYRGTPPEVELQLHGLLPDPCHDLRVVIHAPDAQNVISVQVYSVFDPKKVCIQALRPFDVNILLGTFAHGHYTVSVNGKIDGGFDE